MDEIKTYLVGMDFGQSPNPTALVVVERTIVREGADDLEWHKRFKTYYHVRDLKPYATGTLYTAIADDVRAICAREPLQGNVTLICDASGVGRAVMDTLRERFGGILYPYGITIVGGKQVTRGEHGEWRVPKSDLCSIVRILLETNALQIAKDLPEARTLGNELHDFRVKVTKDANEIYEAREGAHDDIVLATALACWYGENCMPRAPRAPQPPIRDPFAFLG